MNKLYKINFGDFHCLMCAETRKQVVERLIFMTTEINSKNYNEIEHFVEEAKVVKKQRKG